LPRAALGKGFAEGLRGFAESLRPSAKQPAPVVSGMVIGVATGTTIVALVFILLIVIWRRKGKWSTPIVDND
jgi:hypothetical protein